MHHLSERFVPAFALILSCLFSAGTAQAQADPWTRLSVMGSQAQMKREYPLAEKCYREALNKARTKYGEDSSQVVQTLSRLSLLMALRRRWDEADRMSNEAMKRADKLRKNGSFEAPVMLPFEAITEVYETRGVDDSENRERCYLQSLKIKEFIYPKTDRSLLKTVHRMAEHYCVKGEYPKAVPYFNRYIENRSKKIGNNHDEILRMKLLLACCLEKAGKKQEAQLLKDEALARLRSMRGELYAMYSLAVAYKMMKDFDSALLVLKKAIPLAEKQTRPESNLYRSIMCLAGEIYGIKNDFVRAETYYRRYVDSFKSSPPRLQDYGSYRSALGALSHCLSAQNKMAEAQRMKQLEKSVKYKQLYDDLDWLPRYR